jgi:FkbM family methyltransferase
MKRANLAAFLNMISGLLRWLGRQTPSIRYVRAIPNRLLKPLHLALGLEGGVVDVLGFKMCLEPKECVDGNLWFAPHLYDRDEINFLLERMPQDGVFVDVGANIGFWSLYFAHVFPRAKICAIEANPATFLVLRENIEINAFRNIMPLHVGVSDNVGELPLYCNDTGNRGGDSFADYADNRNRCVMVAVKPLADILASAGIERVDVMKMDIEGFEERVLTRFFAEAPRGLWPRFICAEVSHVPKVVFLLQKFGYRIALSERENCVFELGQV